MSKTEEQILSLREAATQLGCSKETVRRAIVSGELEAMAGWGQRGKELRVSSAGLLAWWKRHTGSEALEALVPPAEAVESDPVERPEVVVSLEEAIESHEAVAHEAVKAVEVEAKVADEAVASPNSEPQEPYVSYVVVGDEAVEVGEVHEAPAVEGLGAGGAVPFAVHSHALELALRAMERSQQLERQLEEEREQRARAERQAIALDTELGQYRRALTESAESLAAERARAQTAELLCATLQGAEAEASQRGWGSRLRTWLFGAKP